MELQVGVKIFLKNKDNKYLIVRRNAEKYPETGAKWDIVGGRIDPGSSLMDNLRREVREETKLDIEGEPKLITAQDILKNDKHVVRLTYQGQALDEKVVLSEEHTEYRWLPIGELMRLEPMDSYTKKMLEDFHSGQFSI